MCPKDEDGMANSVDPDQTAPSLLLIASSGTVSSGSTLFAQTCLSGVVCIRPLILALIPAHMTM